MSDLTLCSTCKGNGTEKIPGGVATCLQCGGSGQETYKNQLRIVLASHEKLLGALRENWNLPYDANINAWTANRNKCKAAITEATALRERLKT